MASSQSIRAGAAYVELYVKDNRLVRGLQAASDKLRGFGATIRNIGLGFTAAGGAITAPMLAMLKHFADYGDHLNKMSIRTGIATESLSELGFAAEQSGADLETFEAGLRRMQAIVTDAEQGMKSAQDSFSALGLSISDLSGITPEEQFKIIADRITQVEDATLRAALAMEVFGRRGQTLLPLLTSGRKGIEAMQQEARELGLSVGTDEAQSAADYADAWNRVARSFKAISFVIGSAIAPLLTELLGKVKGYIVTTVRLIKSNKTLVLTVFKIGAALTGIGGTFLVVGGVLAGLGFALSGIVASIGIVAAAIAKVGIVIAALLSPLGLTTAAIVTLSVYLLKSTGVGGQALAWLSAQFVRLRDFAISSVRGIGDALAAGDISLAARILWLSLRVLWQKGVSELTRIWVGFKTGFQSLMSSAIYGVAQLFNTGWSVVEVGWVETTSFLANTWSAFTNLLRKSWHSTVGFIQKAWVRLKSAFDDEINVDAEISEIDRRVNEDRNTADDDLIDDIGDREQRRRQRREEIAARHKAVAEGLTEDHQRVERQRQANAQKSISQAEQDLSQAKQEWQQAIEEAAQKRKAETLEHGEGPNRLAGLKEELAKSANYLQEQKDQSEVKGTFNAFGIRGLAADSLAERTADATEEIATNTKRLLEKANQGKLVFS